MFPPRGLLNQPALNCYLSQYLEPGFEWVGLEKEIIFSLGTKLKVKNEITTF